MDCNLHIMLVLVLNLAYDLGLGRRGINEQTNHQHLFIFRDRSCTFDIVKLMNYFLINRFELV